MPRERNSQAIPIKTTAANEIETGKLHLVLIALLNRPCGRSSNNANEQA